MPAPAEILDLALRRASQQIDFPLGPRSDTASRIEFVCRNLQNRAGARLLLACLLATLHRPGLDIRKPYTEIGDNDCYSGRTYDEQHVTPFITTHQLPCNSSSAFWTPALRNRNIVLTPEVNLVGRPPELYQATLRVLADVHSGRVTAEDALTETIRCLLIVRDERRERMRTLLASLAATANTQTLSAEAIVALLSQHLRCRGASRLPVLVVAAAYRSAEAYLRERMLPLESHSSADEQTGALGDLQIALIDDDDVVTCYEMKNRRVTKADVDRSLQKIADNERRIDNYIFITTEPIDNEVQEHATAIYEETGGIEMVILDCLAFLRYFLHLFHRIRMQYLDAYQRLMLAEPESAVSQPLKEAFLALRQAAQSGE
ncbi:MAG: restriction endonuclease, SacI family [Chloroflexi bacterium]|nr:restriction endonuclease, SacI family [Chloroflexota bacterium]